MQLDQWNVSITVSGDLKKFELQSRLQCLEPGLCLYHFTLQAPQAHTPPQITLKWDWPGTQTLAIWHPTQGSRQTYHPSGVARHWKVDPHPAHRSSHFITLTAPIA